MNLPKDLKRYALGSLLKKLVLFLLLEGVITAVVILFGERLFGKTNIWFRIPATALLLLIPVFITKIYKVFADRTWAGTVKGVSVKSVIVSEALSKTGDREGTYYKNMIFLTLEQTDGKTVTRKADEEKLMINRGKAGNGTNTSEKVTGRFREGDMAFHLYGSNRTVVIPPDDTEYIRDCAVCQSENPSDAEICRVCGHTLVRRDMLTK
jgi:multisubunit Na+/H+ antiporter MnhE subunit